MKASYLLSITLLVSAALGLGWFFENRIPQLETNSLQVPDNIDYYLSNINYRSMNQQGSVHYRFQSSYLEHYIREDISHIDQPSIQFNGEKSHWLIQAKNGKIQHKQEIFELHQQVELRNQSSRDPMLVNTQLMIMKPQNNLIEIPQSMTVITDNLNMQATSAVLDIDQNNHKFTGVKATYQPPTTSNRRFHADS